MAKELINPDYLFEVSWEVCNKVGGIYTVIATKSLYLKKQLHKHHILVGPDVWMDTESNPDFIEDNHLYTLWKAQAASEGLRVRVGRWNVPGRPIAILVDFKQYLTRQNDILTEYWKRFGVDSISGNWDYKENVLFGYAAGHVIESFYNFNLTTADKVVAQFHEWQTGAGLLYLKDKKIPVATVFTTHATVMGRCLAGNNLPLYDSMEIYDADQKARQFGVVARHSIEKISAQNADAFTTVSEITAKECAQFLGREVDVVTPNGFENSFTPATDELFIEKRKAARETLIEVAAAMSGEEVSKDAILIGIGGRYEYRNKGIDVFIDALKTLSDTHPVGRDIQAFIMIPSGHNGADKELAAKLAGNGSDYTTQVSHYLMDPWSDVITRRFRELGFNNDKGSRVKVYFIPSYLNGSDGIFNKTYYDLLAGLDLTLFPSYYEPWGYTPLEAVAFKVPCITTDLAGFGLWANSIKGGYSEIGDGVKVVHRTDYNYSEVADAIKDTVVEFSLFSADEVKASRTNAERISKKALWDKFMTYYIDAYDFALRKCDERNSVK